MDTMANDKDSDELTWMCENTKAFSTTTENINLKIEVTINKLE